MVDAGALKKCKMLIRKHNSFIINNLHRRSFHHCPHCQWVGNLPVTECPASGPFASVENVVNNLGRIAEIPLWQGDSLEEGHLFLANSVIAGKLNS